MRGLDTARPRIRLGPASVSSRASILVGHRITSGIALPCLRLQRCAAMSMPLVSDPPSGDGAVCSGDGDVFVGGDCPYEGGKFACNGDIDDIDGLSGSGEPAMPGA